MADAGGVVMVVDVYVRLSFQGTRLFWQAMMSPPVVGDLINVNAFNRTPAQSIASGNFVKVAGRVVSGAREIDLYLQTGVMPTWS